MWEPPRRLFEPFLGFWFLEPVFFGLSEVFLLQGPPFRTHHSVRFGGILIWLSPTFTISIGAGVVPSMVYFGWRMQQTDDVTQAL